MQSIRNGFFFFSLLTLVINCTPKKEEETTTSSVSAWNAPIGSPVLGVTLNNGWEDLREVPPPVNVTGGWTDSAHIAASGKSLYFAYSKVDDWIFINSGGVSHTYTGPTRTGMIGDEFRIYRADLTDGGWQLNYHPVNASNPNYAEASSSTNFTEDLIIFTRWQVSPAVGGNLYFSTKSGSVWSAPQPLPINSSCEDDNGFVVGSVATGIDIYFESNRADDAGTSCGSKTRIYHSHFDPAGGGTFSAVEKVAGINSTGGSESDTQFFVSPDLSKAYWTTTRSGYYGIMSADRQPNGSYANLQQVAFPNNYTAPFAGKLVWIGEANVSEVSEGWLMYMACGIANGDSGGNPDQVHIKLCRARKPR